VTIDNWGEPNEREPTTQATVDDDVMGAMNEEGSQTLAELNQARLQEALEAQLDNALFANLNPLADEDGR
jgi:hypothetical protein